MSRVRVGTEMRIAPAPAESSCPADTVLFCPGA